MADNENTPSYLPIEISLWFGTKLRNAQFIEFLEELLAGIGNDAATFMGENIVPLLNALKAKLVEINRFPLSYEQTPLIDKQDKIRDIYARILVYAFKRYKELPQDNAAWSHANALSPVMTPLLDMATLGIAEQSTLIKQACDYLTLEANAAHVTALGLGTYVTALNAANNELRTLYRARNQAFGRRRAERGEKTFRDLRVDSKDILKDLFELMNTVYKLQPSEITENVMCSCSGTVEKFKAVAAANGSKVPDDGEDELPDPTPTPDEGEG